MPAGSSSEWRAVRSEFQYLLMEEKDTCMEVIEAR